MRTPHRPAARAAAAALAVLPAVAALQAAVPTSASAAAACKVMTLTSSGLGSLKLVPSSLNVVAGECVQFSNDTYFTAQFTVGKYHESVAGKSQTSGTTNYSATAAGTTQKVTASEGLSSATGSIVIAAKPKPSAGPSQSPAPQPSASAHPGAGSQTTGPTPRAAATPPGPLVVTPTAAPPPASAVALPPSTQAPFLAGTPTPTPSTSSSAPAVVAGPLQPPTGRGTGLPAAVAALLVVATAGALLRVLLAEPVAPVDKRRSVRAAI